VGPTRGVAARLNHPRRARARGAGGNGWAATGPKAGGARGRAGPRRRRPTARRGRGEGEAGYVEGAAGPCQEIGPREEGGFSIYFPYFPLTISSNPLLSANFMESSK
jgi:hypothetical protein